MKKRLSWREEGLGDFRPAEASAVRNVSESLVQYAAILPSDFAEAMQLGIRSPA
ncbi:MAG: hypothetical protein U0894_09705 [Pirellulales bacterium]